MKVSFRPKFKPPQKVRVEDLVDQTVLKLFSQYAQSPKTEIARKVSLQKLLGLYVLSSKIIDGLYQTELQIAAPEANIVSSFFRGYLSVAATNSSEQNLTRQILDDLLPILFVVECEKKDSISDLKSVSQIEVSLRDLTKFLIFVGLGSVKSYQKGEIPVIPLKTCELKRYTRSRIPLDPSDRLKLVKKTPKGEKVLTLAEACFYAVGPYRVLCGFFTEEQTWISEAHLDPSDLKRILKKYKLAARSNSFVENT